MRTEADGGTTVLPSGIDFTRYSVVVIIHDPADHAFIDWAVVNVDRSVRKVKVGVELDVNCLGVGNMEPYTVYRVAKPDPATYPALEERWSFWNCDVPCN